MFPNKIYSFFLIPIFALFFGFSGCAEPVPKQTLNQNTGSPPKTNPGITKFFPAGEEEEIFDETGKPNSITENDFQYFQTPSKDPTEMFRVLITGKQYQVRQIRGSKFLRRKPDPGGDALIVEDVAKFDGIKDLLDDGTIVIKLNPKSGKVENVNFGTRTTRVGNFSKIIQNDSTRWNLEHLTPEPTVTKYTVTYYIQVKGSASRDEIKEKLRGEVKK